jgi:hypothetical protein
VIRGWKSFKLSPDLQTSHAISLAKLQAIISNSVYFSVSGEFAR